MLMCMDIIDEDEIVRLIDWLSEFGRDSNGGITRLLYTKDWLEAQNALKELLSRKGFHTYFDEIGNLFSRLEGSIYKDETILTGSHIDTVVNGGSYDGQFGIISGIIAMEYLRKAYGDPLRNIEVVSLAEEEGSRFPFTFWGSKNVVGAIYETEMEDIKDMDGIFLSNAMRDLGFNYREKESKIRDDIKAFIELHVEQGGVLEVEKKSIGIVHHIVGQERYFIEVIGEANHAGTTPMVYRRDALNGASRMIMEIDDIAVKYGEPLVATVGRIEVTPNATNVVPGKVVFSLDVRHVNKDIMDKYIDEVIYRLKDIAKTMELDISINKYMDGKPVKMDSNLVKIIEEQCIKEGLSYKIMHSGAGHDAQIFAEHVPTAMIFIPSSKGISHNPNEYTDLKDLVEGIKAIIGTLYFLAYKQ